jgi:hypothetical protein
MGQDFQYDAFLSHSAMDRNKIVVTWIRENA